MDTPTNLRKVHQDHHLSTTTITTINNPLKPIKATKTHEPLSSKLKCVKKKRSAVKKDRQSKIHTAQGLRDRRMRLSVHTARKFFDLNDMLGFDKASKTIEWLFSKSREAIEEITETLQSQAVAVAVAPTKNNDTRSPFSACETESVMEVVAAAAEKDESLKLHGDQINDQDESLMVKNLGKTKQFFQSDPNVDFHQSQLGFPENNHIPDDHNMKESSSSSSSSCYPLEFSNTYHFLKHLHLDNTVRNVDTYMGNVNVTSNISSINHSIFDYTKSISEPQACWVNSRNPLLGFLGGWNSENPRMESSNRSIVPNMSPLNDNMNMSSNFINFHSENRGQ